MNYLNPAWLEGLYNPRYRGTGRTQRMIKLMALEICEIEQSGYPETLILCAETNDHVRSIYHQTLQTLHNLIRLKDIKYTKIIKGDLHYFSQINLYGLRIKEQNIFIDHYVYEKEDEGKCFEYRYVFFEKLKYITIPNEKEVK